MAHPEQMEFVRACLDEIQRDGVPFQDLCCLEIGSRDINGSPRRWFSFPPNRYVGVDAHPGRGVDVVGHAADLGVAGLIRINHDQRYHVVICCEALEHDERWKETINVALSVIEPCGYLIVTCATDPRKPHGVNEWSADPGKPYYQNISLNQLNSQLNGYLSFSKFIVDHEIGDLYLFGRIAS